MRPPGNPIRNEDPRKTEQSAKNFEGDKKLGIETRYLFDLEIEETERKMFSH